MDYGMRGGAQTSTGSERRLWPIDAVGILDNVDPGRGGYAGMGAITASRKPVTDRENGMRVLPCDEEFYEVFSEIRLP